MKKIGAMAFAVSALALLCGCSSFSRQWSAARKEPVSAADMAGPWEGSWISDANGHHGKLRCIITEKSPIEYDANFRATYEHILHFSYTVPLNVQKQDRNFIFSGEADLGKLAGGVYKYQGAATPTNFFSTYDSKYDHGKFEMHRPSS